MASRRRATRKSRKATRKSRKSTRRMKQRGGAYCSDDCPKGGKHDISGVTSHAPMQAKYKCKKCGEECVNAR